MESPSKKQKEVKIPSFAFIGKMCSGKNTYADRLRARLELEFGVSVYRPAISEKINEIAKDLFGMKEKDRMLMQDIGSKMKEIDKRVWARYLVRDIRGRGRMPFVIDGLRFPEDIEVLKENFPELVVVKLESDEKERLEMYRKTYGRYPTKKELENVTEREIARLPADMTLFNKYDKEELELQIEGIVKSIKDVNQ